MTDQELAAELRELAAHPALAARAAQLREVADAVLSPDLAERWCEVDLFAAFPPEETVRPDHPGSARWWHALLTAAGLVQPVLVFLPISITWLGLKNATTAYGELLAIAGAEAARRPFLELWQQGFDGRLPAWQRFDGVALATLVAIFLLIAVTFAERLLRRMAERRSGERTEALRARLRTALTAATLVLAEARLASPARFQAELGKSAVELRKVGQTIGRVHAKVVPALEKALDSTGRATDALVAAADGVRGSIPALTAHLTAVTDAAKDLLEAVERVAGAVDSVGRRTDAAVDRVGDRVGGLITTATDGVRQALDEFTAAAGRMVADTAAHLDTRVGELTGATAGLGSAVSRVEAVAARSGDRLADAVTQAAGAFTTALENAGAEVRQALGDWADTASAHAARIELVSDAAGRTAHLLQETRDALDRLPADLARTLQELPTAVRDAARPELAALRAAVAGLDDAVRQATSAFTGATGARTGAPGGRAAGGPSAPAGGSGAEGRPVGGPTPGGAA